jgi:LmbE family N-acetylglucosaminyl deacetylase
MLELGLKGAKTVLCLGAHADDIEIGCGGTLMKLARQTEGLDVWWVVFSAEGQRAREARRSAQAFLRNARGRRIVLKRFRNAFFPYQGAQIKRYFEQLKRAVQPDLIFTHFRDDLHQDHRVVSELTWNTFRNHLVLEYEIPKYDGDLGRPNVFVPLDAATSRRKAEQVCEFFRTQGNKHWFSVDTFLSLMRMRGIECASRTRYAEAFYCRKLVCA